MYMKLETKSSVARGYDGLAAPTSRRLNVVVRSPPLFSRGGPKWRDNYPEGPDYPVAPNHLKTTMMDQF